MTRSWHLPWDWMCCMNPFVISLDATQPELLTLDYVIHCLLNEDVHYDNQEKGKVSDRNKEVKVKKDKDSVCIHCCGE